MNLLLIIVLLIFLKIIHGVLFKYNVKTYPNTSIDIISKYYNNQYIQSNKNNKKIYVFMSYDYIKLPDYAKYTIELMNLYCKKHNYSFITFNHNGQKEISPYWLRVKDFVHLTHDVLKEDDILIYFDLDSIINPDYHNWKIEKILDSLDSSTKNNWNMYVSIDPIEYMLDSFNTGIIAVRNTKWTREFLKYWLNSYPKERWYYDEHNKKWYCNICLWAGDQYEQGTLSRLYDENIYNCKENILPVDVSIFGNPNHTKNDTFTIHLMGVSNSNRTEIFKELYEKLI